MKNRKEIKGPRKVNTHAIIGNEKKNPQKNKAPDSQTSQAAYQTKEIDRAHRSHSTRDANQNETNKNNQGSPIKTIKSHSSIFVPLLGRGVFTAGFAPARPFPTPSYKCVGGSRSRKSRLVARRRLASSSSLCQEVMNFTAPCNTPLCYGARSSIFAARVHTTLPTLNVSRLSTVEPSVAPNAWKSSLRQSIQFCSGRPLAGSSPPTSFPSISRFGRRPAGCLAMAPANRGRRCRMVASTLWHPAFLKA